MTTALVTTVILIMLVLIILMVLFTFIPVGLWISALAAGVNIGIFTLIGMRLRRVAPIRIVNPLIKAHKAGLGLTPAQLEAHYLAGGNVDKVVNALIAAERAAIPLKFERAALAYADLVLLDVKHTDAGSYRKLTGGDLNVNRAFLDYCREKSVPLWVRQVILPGWNDTAEDIASLLGYIKGANVKKIELLPYHTLGVHKWEALGLSYPLTGLCPPSEELMSRLREAAALFSANISKY